MAHMREETLLQHWNRMGLAPKHRGRPTIPIHPNDQQRILNYLNKYNVGYLRCYEGVSQQGSLITEWQTRTFFETEGLYTNEKEYCPTDSDRIRYVAKYPNQIWHTDLHMIKINDVKLYLIAFLDDRTRFILFYKVLETKEMIETANALLECIQINQITPSCIVIDNGKEFIGEDFQNVMRSHNIEDWRTQPYTPQQNGKIERFWLTLMKSIKSELPIIEQLPDVIQEYNTTWNHSALKKLYGEPMTPQKAWLKGPIWIEGMEKTIDFSSK